MEGFLLKQAYCQMRFCKGILQFVEEFALLFEIFDHIVFLML